MEAMAQPLPKLRMDLDFMPSPFEDRPGLLIRDPHLYSDATLIIPPPLVQCLQRFDGRGTDLDLRADLVRLTGSLNVSRIQENLVGTLSQAGFLENETFFRLRDQRHQEFSAAPVREPTHAGSAYPEDPDELRGFLEGYLARAGDVSAVAGAVGVAAPHVSPEGGWKMYAAAYRAIPEEAASRTFVILGTSHYGLPGRFGLTRKPFRTPYGIAETETRLVERLAEQAPGAAVLEDYCHRTEHSIEFQVVFLQHRFGADIRILPILCGSFSESVASGRLPEESEPVRRFFDALAGLADEEGDNLFWVLGIDMAHIGRRYGDPFAARANQGVMSEVAERDRRRIGRLAAGDPAGFWRLVCEREDDLKWCGSSPLYTFFKAVPDARCLLLGYEQWNIDEASVVTFGALAMQRDHQPEGPGPDRCGTSDEGAS